MTEYKAAQPADLARLVHFEETPDGQRWVVGAGNSRAGMRGRSIGVISLKHSPGYEIVMQLDNGRIDTFAPYQLFPEQA
jgi:hypothetical protein